VKTASAQPLVVEKILKKNTCQFSLYGELGRYYIRQPLSLAYPKEVNLEKLPSSIVDIPLITNILPVIWFLGKTYSIPEMDEDLYNSSVKIKEFYKRFFYNTTWEGELKPKRLVKNNIKKTGNGSAALFSGGLDSSTTMLRHFDERPTLISFNDIHEEAVSFAKKHHFTHATIRFNYYDFLKLNRLDRASIDITKWFWDTTMGLAWVGVTAPYLYTKGIPRLYVPSGFTWDSFIFPDGQTMQQPASPLIDENLSPMGLKVTHDIFTMTRTDKIKFISTFCHERKIPKPHLVVCNRHARSNTSYSSCNKCVKCYITMLDIMAIGEDLQDYGFTISKEDFIAQFKSYIETLKMRRGGTYTALHDTQLYLKQNLAKLPKVQLPFYNWFLSIDLWSRVSESENRPLRTTPFSWSDYTDLYPNIKDWRISHKKMK
jgi:hypothetical protein